MVGVEFETQASEDVLIVDKPQHHRGPGTNNYYMMSDFHVSQHTRLYMQTHFEYYTGIQALLQNVLSNCPMSLP